MTYDGAFLRSLPPCPVTFNYEGKEVKGELGFAVGAGGLTWFLMVNNFYWGQLHFWNEKEWRFTSNTQDLGHLADHFGETLIAWIEGYGNP